MANRSWLRPAHCCQFHGPVIQVTLRRPELPSPRLELLSLPCRSPAASSTADRRWGATLSCSVTVASVTLRLLRLVTNGLMVYQRGPNGIPGREFYPRPARDKQARFGNSLPRETFLPGP